MGTNLLNRTRRQHHQLLAAVLDQVLLTIEDG